MNSPVQRSVLAVVVALCAACSADSVFGVSESGDWTPGTAAHDVVVGDLTRTFLLHVPAHYPKTSTGMRRSYSLIIVLHGSAGSADAIRHSSGMDSVSETYMTLVAYPNGTHGRSGLYPADWNAGTCCGAAARENIDDVGFIKAVIDRVSKQLPVDQKRIYIAGFSDGGRMAYHAACQLSSTIAAIGVVSGSLLDDHCTPAKSVALIAVHGTADDEVPYDDDALTSPPTAVPSTAMALPPSLQFWTSENGCSTSSESRPSPHVLETTFSACTGADVVFYGIQGGLHGWPGEPDGNGSEPPMSELHASDVVAKFFNQHFRR
jgi:polyhydroxybutyrate depolymerase